MILINSMNLPMLWSIKQVSPSLSNIFSNSFLSTRGDKYGTVMGREMMGSFNPFVIFLVLSLLSVSLLFLFVLTFSFSSDSFISSTNFSSDLLLICSELACDVPCWELKWNDNCVNFCNTLVLERNYSSNIFIVL